MGELLRRGLTEEGHHVVVARDGATGFEMARAAQFDVIVLERGRRFRENDFPSLPEPHEVFPDLARWGWTSSVVATACSS